MTIFLYKKYDLLKLHRFVWYVSDPFYLKAAQIHLHELQIVNQILKTNFWSIWILHSVDNRTNITEYLVSLSKEGYGRRLDRMTLKEPVWKNQGLSLIKASSTLSWVVDWKERKNKVIKSLNELPIRQTVLITLNLKFVSLLTHITLIWYENCHKSILQNTFTPRAWLQKFFFVLMKRKIIRSDCVFLWISKVALWIDGDMVAKCCFFRFDVWKVTVHCIGRKNFLVALLLINVDLVSVKPEWSSSLF